MSVAGCVWAEAGEGRTCRHAFIYERIAKPQEMLSMSS